MPVTGSATLAARQRGEVTVTALAVQVGGHLHWGAGRGGDLREVMVGLCSKTFKNVFTYATIDVRTPERLRTRLRVYANRLQRVLAHS